MNHDKTHGVTHESTSASTSDSQRAQKDLTHTHRPTGVIMSGFSVCRVVLSGEEWLLCSLAYLTARNGAKSTSGVSMTIKTKVFL